MSYKVEEPDGTTTVYDNQGNFKFKQDPDWPLVPSNQSYSNAVVPSTQSNALVPSTQSNALVPSESQSDKGSFGWRDALALAAVIANTKNPFSSSGKTVGGSVVSGGKKLAGWFVDKIRKKKKSKANKTTKPQTQTKTQTKPQTQTKTQTLTKPQTQTSATKTKELTYPRDIMADYERDSIKKFELLQRKSVPWKMPSIEAGITRMTGFEPFSATADQTFNVFYGGGSIDPFLRS